MRKLRNICMLLLLMLVFAGMTAFAAEPENDSLIQMSQGENEKSLSLAVLPSEDMVKNAATTLKLTFQVTDVKGGASADVAVTYDAKLTEGNTISEYRYDAGTGALSLYLSAPQALFSGQDEPVKIGTMNFSSEAEEVSLDITPKTFEYVDQTHTSINIPEEELKGMGMHLEWSVTTPPGPDDPVDPDDSTAAVVGTYEEVMEKYADPAVTSVTLVSEGAVTLTKEQQQEIWKQIKGKDRTFTIQVTKNGKLLYSIKFDGRTLKDESVTMDFGLELGIKNDDLEALLDKDAKHLIMEFKHSGKLPGPAEITVYVGDKFPDGQSLFLYYYNEATKKVEPEQKEVIPQNGYATTEIDHCSIYVLTTKEVKDAGEFTNPGASSVNSSNNAKTGDTTSIIIPVLIMLLAVAVITAIIIRRKRK